MFLEISVISCTAVAPVPITATRLSLSSTEWCGQRAVCQLSPAKISRPGMSGMNGSDKPPIAVIRKRARTSSPFIVVIFQSRCDGS